MILTVTLNTALDVTYRVDRLRPHHSHRIHGVAVRAGGKGVNVARVLHALGHEVLATGFAGGMTGAAVQADLAAAGVPEAMVGIDAESRRTVTVVDVDATVFNEPGPLIGPGEWQRFVDGYSALLPKVRAVVLSGSLPPGVDPDGYAVLADLARRQGVPVVLDADGDALRHGLSGRPAVVTPNAAELAGVVAGPVPEAAHELRERGAQAVVVSCGPDGLVAVTEAGCWRAVPPERVAGNPTGAGDAVAAALAVGLADGRPWPQRLADAVALGAAAVAAPLAGDFDAHTYRRLLPLVVLEQIHPTAPREGAPCR